MKFTSASGLGKYNLPQVDKSLYRHKIKVNNCIIYDHKLKTVPDMLLKHVTDMEIP